MRLPRCQSLLVDKHYQATRPRSRLLTGARKDPTLLSISEAVSDLKARKTTPSALLNGCLERIAARNGHLNAYTHLASTDELVRKAQLADARWAQGTPQGPLDGIPIAVKANICTEGHPTTCASNILKDFISPIDATAVRLLIQHGAMILGKTNMDEFGMGSTNIHSAHGPTYNPLGPVPEGHLGGRSPGGSSGGSSSAVAANMCFAALGSDTGGSVRTPAAYTGIVGFKPSYGRFSRRGLVAYASSLDTIGLLTKKVVDAKILYDILAQYDEKDSTCVQINEEPTVLHGDLNGVRVGIPQEYFMDGLSSAVLHAWNAAAQHLASRGATVVPVSLPNTKHALPAYYVIAPAEASSNLARYDGVRYGHQSERCDTTLKHELYTATRTEGFGTEVKRRIMLGTFVLQANSYTSYFLQAQKLRRLVQSDFDNVFAKPNPLRSADSCSHNSAKGVDVLLTPSAMGAAPLLADIANDTSETSVNEYADDALTIPASLAGLPALVIPYGQDVEGMPVGVQILGQYGNDRAVLDIGKMLEACRTPN
ncbi:glutaminyl-tRNA synthase (glutamine-hydrolysing) [Spizellomyces sp. 'palustris']|nr:glutaminyl-tRNA synthase (glutamine-hydrolysing) [Spizellomyces sp. 'palustris']